MKKITPRPLHDRRKYISLLEASGNLPALLKIAALSIATAVFLSSCSGTNPENQLASEQQVCRSFVISGSKIPKRVCATAEEWESNDRAEAQQAERFFNDSLDNANPGADVNSAGAP